MTNKEKFEVQYTISPYIVNNQRISIQEQAEKYPAAVAKCDIDWAIDMLMCRQVHIVRQLKDSRADGKPSLTSDYFDMCLQFLADVASHVLWLSNSENYANYNYSIDFFFPQDQTHIDVMTLRIIEKAEY